MKQSDERSHSLSDKQHSELPAKNGCSEKERQAKARNRLQPTVEEVSDEEASSRIERTKEIPKHQPSGRTDRFTEPYFTPSAHQVESATDEERGYRFPQTTNLSQPASRTNHEKLSTFNQRNFPAFEELSGYQFSTNSGIELQLDDHAVQESAGSAEEQHVLWKPPVVLGDDSGDDDGGEELLYSVAFGGQGVDNTSRVSKAEAEPQWHQKAPNLVRTSGEKRTEKKDSAGGRNASKKKKEKGAGKALDVQNCAAELGVLDDTTAWEAAMMEKFIGLAQTS